MNQIIIPDEIISNKIYLIRNQKVMIDRDLAIRSEERRVGKEC